MGIIEMFTSGLVALLVVGSLGGALAALIGSYSAFALLLPAGSHSSVTLLGLSFAARTGWIDLAGRWRYLEEGWVCAGLVVLSGLSLLSGEVLGFGLLHGVAAFLWRPLAGGAMLAALMDGVPGFTRLPEPAWLLIGVAATALWTVVGLVLSLLLLPLGPLAPVVSRLLAMGMVLAALVLPFATPFVVIALVVYWDRIDAYFRHQGFVGVLGARLPDWVWLRSLYGATLARPLAWIDTQIGWGGDARRRSPGGASGPSSTPQRRGTGPRSDRAGIAGTRGGPRDGASALPR